MYVSIFHRNAKKIFCDKIIERKICIVSTKVIYYFQVNSPPLNDQQHHLQMIIREKLKGYCLPVTKCRSALLIDLAHEIKELKEELENGKIGK